MQSAFPPLMLTPRDSQEMVDLLVKLVKNACVNPPGGEIRSVETISEALDGLGLQILVAEPKPGRANLLVTVKGSDPSHPRLIFGPSHLDVVPVEDTHKWTHPPFDGVISDGFVWGRGTSDMLGLVVAQVIAFKKLVTEGFQPKGDLSLFLVSDEEAGGKDGAQFMVDHYQNELLGDPATPTYSVSEGGGFFLLPNVWYMKMGEKQPLGKKLTFKGSSWHGSIPIGGNPIVKASKAVLKIQQFAQTKLPLDLTYISPLADQLSVVDDDFKLLTQKETFEEGMKRLEATYPVLTPLLTAISGMTWSVNQFKGGETFNVVPSTATVGVDIRVLPHQTDEEVRWHLNKALGDLAQDCAIEPLEGFESPPLPVVNVLENCFVRCVETLVQERYPDVVRLKGINPGASDARIMAQIGIQTYGVGLHDPSIPFKEYGPAHGTDEKVALSTLDNNLWFMYNLAKRFLS